MDKQVDDDEQKIALNFENLDIICGEAVSPNYDTIHTRRIFFINNNYWLIWDNLKGETLRQFDLRFHLTPEAWNHVFVQDSTVVAPNLSLVFEKGENISIEPSWASPEYGIKHRIPCVSVVSEGEANKDFFTMIKPLGNDEKPPILHISNKANQTNIEITGDSFRDILSFELAGENIKIEEFKHLEVTK